MNFPQLTSVKAVEKYKLLLHYNDETRGILDLSHLAGIGVFQQWENGNIFFDVFINPEGRGITWSNQLDICPDAAFLTIQNLTYEEWKCQV